MVTQQQIDFFQENGYLKFGKVLDSDGVDAMRAGLDAVIELELTQVTTRLQSSNMDTIGMTRNWIGRAVTRVQFISMSTCGSENRTMRQPSTTRSSQAQPAHSWIPPKSVSGTIRLSPNPLTTTGISDTITTSSFGP